MREKILHAIAKNSKISTADLALMLGVSEAAVKAEIQALEEEHIICGYPTLINWDFADDERVTAIIEVKVTPQRGRGFDRIAERIYKFDEVSTVYLVSGNFDLAVIIEGKSMREVASFVSDKLAPLEAILSTSTNFILKKYKENGMPLVNAKDEDERLLVTP